MAKRINQVLTNVLLATTFTLFSQDTGERDEQVNVVIEPSDITIHQVDKTSDVNIAPIEKEPEQSEEILTKKPLDLSLPDDIGNNHLSLSQEDCRRFSESFKPVSCMNENYLSDQHLAMSFDEQAKNGNGFLSGLGDCSSVVTPNEDSSEQSEAKEAWRCIGNFKLLGNDSWSFKFGSAVRQNLDDADNKDNRFGICPEGNIDCLSPTLQIEIRN